MLEGKLNGLKFLGGDILFKQGGSESPMKESSERERNKSHKDMGKNIVSRIFKFKVSKERIICNVRREKCG